MINKQILKGIGLTGNEAEIYLILLELGEASIYNIADYTKISRPNVYDIIKTLSEKGLVSLMVKNNKKYYKPVAPEKLIEILKEKENNLLEILPKLNELYKEKIKKPLIEIFQGSEGLKTIMNDMVKQKREIWIFNGVSIDYILKKIPDFNLKRFLSEKKRLGIKTKMLHSKDVKSVKGPGYQLKQLPEENLGCVSYWTYGNIVGIGIWSEPLIIIRVIDESVAKVYKNSIKLVWDSLK